MTPDDTSEPARRSSRWWSRAAAAAAVAVLVPLAPSALAQAGPHRTAHAKAMVRVVDVTGFGTILETRHGLPLYLDTAPPCTAGCLAVWPPLLMPGSKTVPTGSSCLATTPFGSRLQVTYDGRAVYTFITDAKHRPPTGNGVQSFAVVTVPAPGC